MKIRIYPSSSDTYHSIVIDTDDIPVCKSFFDNEDLPSLFIDDLICGLITEN